jgi:glycosyltransferase involved in cell wall biosynthesis
MADDVRILALFGGATKLGMERANLEALSALREGGATVRILMSDAPWAEDLRQDVVSRGFEIVQCPYLLLPRPERRFNPLFEYPKVIARASAIMLREVVRFRPTHFYTCAQMFVLNFAPVLMLTSTPLIYRCGDRPIRHSRLFRGLWRFIVARSSTFVAVSHYIADRLAEAGVPPDRVTVIYSRPPLRSPRAETTTRASAAFTFVFVGQINETKGPHLLVDAFRDVRAAHPDARLVIAGRISDWEGDEWARALRREVEADPHLADCVTFPGFVEDVPALLASGQVAVTPTVTEEPLANVVMEAKLAGIPSIIFPSGGLPETIEHGVDGFICADRTTPALRDALTWYLEHREAAAVQGQAARQSLQRFGIDNFVGHWRAVIDRTSRGARA